VSAAAAVDVLVLVDVGASAGVSSSVVDLSVDVALKLVVLESVSGVLKHGGLGVLNDNELVLRSSVVAAGVNAGPGAGEVVDGAAGGAVDMVLLVREVETEAVVVAAHGRRSGDRGTLNSDNLLAGGDVRDDRLDLVNDGDGGLGVVDVAAGIGGPPLPDDVVGVLAGGGDVIDRAGVLGGVLDVGAVVGSEHGHLDVIAAVEGKSGRGDLIPLGSLVVIDCVVDVSVHLVAAGVLGVPAPLDSVARAVIGGLGQAGVDVE